MNAMTKNSLKIDHQLEKGTPVFFFAGAIDESSLLDLKLPTDRPVALDLHSLVRVNSAGIQKWIFWTKENLKAKAVSLRRINPSLARVASITEGLMPSTWDIESFYVPYVNESNSEPEDILYIRDRHFTARELRIPPVVSSTVTQHRLALDVIPEKYFLFLKMRYPGISIIVPPEL